MTKPLWPSIARLLAPLKENGYTPKGVGFLVSENHILTCSHVIADALKIPRDTKEKPDQEVTLDFPIVALGDFKKARVFYWNQSSDIAILEINDRPKQTAPIHLIELEKLVDRKFRVYGVPEHYDTGDWIEGVVQGPIGGGQFKIEGQSENRPKLGYSGSPLWDDASRTVIGMFATADEKDKEAKAGSMIPVNKLIEILDEQHIPRPKRERQEIKQFTYACFFSFPKKAGQQYSIIHMFAQELYDALSVELETFFTDPVRIYFNPNRSIADSSIAQSLCESVCLIAILTPPYIDEHNPLCAAEYMAMEDFEGKRLSAEIHFIEENHRSLIIPVYLHPKEYQYASLIGSRKGYPFLNWAPGSLKIKDRDNNAALSKTGEEYWPFIKEIARHIYDCCQALCDSLDDPCSCCAEAQLPDQNQLAGLFKKMPRKPLGLPTRRMPNE